MEPGATACASVPAPASPTTPVLWRRPRALVPLLVALAALPACGPSPDPVSPPHAVAVAAPTAAAKSAQIAPPPKLEIPPDPSAIARITADVTYLASPELAGRGTGEEGARKAADYIAKRFATFNLAPFGDHEGDRDKQGARGYLQRFEARVGATVDPPALAVESGAPAKKAAAAAASIVTSDGSESGTATGEIVLVGYGITAPALTWDDYAGIDVAGKVVLVLSGAPKVEGKDKRVDVLRDFGSARYKIRTAREHKAVGVVFIAATDELPSPPVDASSMGVPAIAITRSAASSLFPGAKLGDKATWEIRKPSSAKPLAKTKVSITTSVKPVMADAWNVIAMLPAREGSKHSDEWVVLGAHYDHLGHGGAPSSRAPGVRDVHPGADDNASGTALLLDAARRFALLPGRPERNILFMGFGAEEIGAIGSRYWVDHAPVPIKSVVAMINADMVGRLRENKILMDGSATAAAWPDIAKAAGADLGLHITFGGEGFGSSDQASFAAARVPVAFLFTGVHDDYHKPSDTADKINAEGIERVTTLASRMLLAVSGRAERLAFIDAPADPHRASRGGFRVSIGTVPDYAFTGKGMRLTGVRPDAPAARAGLQGGDIIVKVGSHEITNVHDFMYALGELEAGREVVIEVLRDGKRMPLKVIPAPGR